MPIYAADDDPQALPAVRVQDGYENRLYLEPVLRGRYPEDLLAAIDRESNLAARSGQVIWRQSARRLTCWA